MSGSRAIVLIASVLLLGNCADVEPCRPNTLFLSYRLPSAITVPSAIDVLIEIDGQVVHDAPFTVQHIEGSIEIRFPSYPQGDTAAVTLTAGGFVLFGSVALAPVCTTLRLDATHDLAEPRDVTPPADGVLPDTLGPLTDLVTGDAVGGGDDMVSDDMVSDDAAVGPVDMAPPADLKCAADLCEGNVFKQCKPDGTYDSIDCGVIGCAESPAPHCKTIVPQLPVKASDLNRTLFGAPTFSSNTTLHSGTGAIAGLRAANADPAVYEVVNNIGFRVESGIGIYNFAALTIPDGVKVTVTGTQPVALTSNTSITITGILDLQGSCAANQPGAGGSYGGNPGSNGLGAGMGKTPANVSENGGGGGYGDNGGSGATDLGTANFGSSYGASLNPLVGGSGGAGGKATSYGGGGGGAVQLVAASQITIGGAGILAGINAGGCGGKQGSGGGGGGSGGAILLQARVVSLADGGGLAANGGGGGPGAGTGGSAGGNGTISTLRAAGGMEISSYRGGDGGAAGNPIGQSAPAWGGGGGSVGRIRIDTLEGLPSLTPSYILSPDVTDTNALGEHPTTFGMITTM